MKLEHLSLRTLMITYRRAVELNLDQEFIQWIHAEIKRREKYKQGAKANL
ncbi:sporulation histidine kinase inhibitor Sda [Halobacillus seohaensis]|uniref:Sporulation histidine kinase inhibitor Sda n=1 Tax=Halobacillus seohaensis TaxID=447421 RepID=A0ABW2ENS8_9BACI